VRPLPLTVIPTGNPPQADVCQTGGLASGVAHQRRTKRYARLELGPFSLALAARCFLALRRGALLSCACGCGALLSCACGCGALPLLRLPAAERCSPALAGCGALLSCALRLRSAALLRLRLRRVDLLRLHLWRVALLRLRLWRVDLLCWASGGSACKSCRALANIIDALLILSNPPIFEVAFGFCNLVLLVRLTPTTKRIKK